MVSIITGLNTDEALIAPPVTGIAGAADVRMAEPEKSSKIASSSNGLTRRCRGRPPPRRVLQAGGSVTAAGATIVVGAADDSLAPLPRWMMRGAESQERRVQLKPAAAAFRMGAEGQGEAARVAAACCYSTACVVPPINAVAARSAPFHHARNGENTGSHGPLLDGLAASNLHPHDGRRYSNAAAIKRSAER